MRLNPNQIKKLVRLILEGLEGIEAVKSNDEKNVYEVVESIIVKDLKQEEELEKEAENLIRKHTAVYHTDELDYELLFKRAKYELAKKKGFKL